MKPAYAERSNGTTRLFIVGWATGADIFYAVVVAFVTLAALDGRLTLRRALTHLASAAVGSRSAYWRSLGLGLAKALDPGSHKARVAWRPLH